MHDNKIKRTSLALAIVATGLLADAGLAQTQVVRGFNDQLYETTFDEPRIVADNSVGCAWELIVDDTYDPSFQTWGPGLTGGNEFLLGYNDIQGHTSSMAHGYAQLLIGYRAQDNRGHLESTDAHSRTTNLEITLRRTDSTECKSELEIQAQPQFTIRCSIENDATLASEYSNVSGWSEVSAPAIGGFTNFLEARIDLSDTGSTGSSTILGGDPAGLIKFQVPIPSSASTTRLESFTAEMLGASEITQAAEVFFTAVGSFSFLADGWIVVPGVPFDDSRVEGHLFASVTRMSVLGICFPPEGEDLSCAGLIEVRGGFGE